MRVLVYGAGVVGSTYAAMIKQAGYDVTVLARGKRYIDLKNHGIILKDALTGKKSKTKVKVINILKPDNLYDYIIVTTRKNQLSSVTTILASNMSPTIIFLMNNLSPDKLVSQLGQKRIILGFPSVAGKIVGKTVVSMVAKLNFGVVATTLGELDGRVTTRLRIIVRVLQKSGFFVRNTNRIIDWLLTHGTFVVFGAKMLAKYNYNNYQLASSITDVKRGIILIRQGFSTLRKKGYRLTPSIYNLIYLPLPILVSIFTLALNTKLAEIWTSWYCRAAPDEFASLEQEYSEIKSII